MAVTRRFYFDVTVDGQTLADDEGLDLSSLDAARKEALTAAAEMAKEGDARPKEIAVEIREPGGAVPVATVRLSLVSD
jgi:hypothetical protein